MRGGHAGQEGHSALLNDVMPEPARWGWLP